MDSLRSPVQFLPGVGLSRAQRLKKLGLATVQDALFFFPRDYEHPAPEVPIDGLSDGTAASVTGTVTDAELTSRAAGRSVFGAVVTNETGSVRMVFFNQPFRAETISLERRVMITGTPKMSGMRMEFVHPKVRFLREDEAGAAGEIAPVYPLTEGFKQVDIRRITSAAIEMALSGVEEVMPESLRVRISDSIREAGLSVPAVAPDGPLPKIQDAIRQIHFPTDDRSLLAARTRFIFQELLVMQLALAMRRRRLTTDLAAPELPAPPDLRTRIRQRFPFELTGDQKRTIDEVCRDLSRQFPMNRLIQGDVGSGKTVVALYSMMLAANHGYQSVFLVPTEVLARQHLGTLKKLLGEQADRAIVLSGSLKSAERREVLERIADGRALYVVGTQALLYEVPFHRLGLCVIDEQHKFGVEQRTRLRAGDLDPHYLHMSATPIPRSIALTMFGDVDLSTIRDKPPGRSEVHTYLAVDEWTSRWWEFVDQRVEEGRQVYVVAPRVDVMDSTRETDLGELEMQARDDRELISAPEDITSVLAMHDQLSAGRFSHRRVGLLHGRLTTDEKNQVMQAFDEGDIDILVTTTVIEVGIDVPNATVMAIMGANRFGLAQLHQLRGRVSRGVHPGHVAVFTDGEAPPHENERLREFERTLDGFDLAEADFRMRGPGELIGKRQSGLPPMKVADFSRDIELLAVARSLAQSIVDEDPDLSADDLQKIRRQVLRRYGKKLEISDA